MCGFAGFLGGAAPDGAMNDLAVITRMTNAIAHRGPDDAGHWLDAEQRVALGHRRLSIVDLSSAGHQPMQSASGRYMFVFNGEIYNHGLLRKELEKSGHAPCWRGHADTETLLAGFDAWGIQGTIERAIGMFAFAVWDRESASLILGRDRMGEKPLYYGWQGKGRHTVFLFGSELKALRPHPAFEGTIDRGALSLQMRHNYIPAPHSIYEGISKLPPGHLLTVSLQQREEKTWAYWSVAQAAESGAADSFQGSPEQAVDALEKLLKDAVRQQMVADVPLGAFLSGGVDSSAIVALMQAQSARPVKTFTIGFHEDGFNEAEHAKAVARHLGTDHTELYISAEQARAVIPKLPTLYDEPFSDSSQIPTFLVSQLARSHVTVSLSGDAGDELFCGYTRYRRMADLWDRISLGPLPLRRLAVKGVGNISPRSWERMVAVAGAVMPASSRASGMGEKLHKAASLLECRSVESLYLRMASHWYAPASLVISGHEPPLLVNEAPANTRLDNIQRMMLVDMMTYLPDDILAKVDRAAMGVSLETRVPYLDHRVVEFAWRLPQSVKLREGVTKWVLRQVLYRHVPRELFTQPKMGFGVPIGKWLRGPLRDWAEALLDESRLRQEGFFHPALVRKKWNEHLSGEPRQFYLWDVLMFQAWMEQQRDAATVDNASGERLPSRSMARVA